MIILPTLFKVLRRRPEGVTHPFLHAIFQDIPVGQDTAGIIQRQMNMNEVRPRRYFSDSPRLPPPSVTIETPTGISTSRPNKIVLDHDPIISGPFQFHAPMKDAISKFTEHLTLVKEEDLLKSHADSVSGIFSGVSGRPMLLQLNVAMLNFKPRRGLGSSCVYPIPTGNLFIWYSAAVTFYHTRNQFDVTLMYYNDPPM